MRLPSTKLKECQADDSCNRELQYELLLDRAGATVTRHTIGETLTSDRGCCIFWALSAVNDVQDYERDILAGETNNLARGMSSDQQLIDTVLPFCLSSKLALALDDFDGLDALLGTTLWVITYWRYNTPKQLYYYESKYIRDFKIHATTSGSRSG